MQAMGEQLVILLIYGPQTNTGITYAAMEMLQRCADQHIMQHNQNLKLKSKCHYKNQHKILAEG